MLRAWNGAKGHTAREGDRRFGNTAWIAVAAPAAVAFNGKRAAQVYLGRQVEYGLQPEKIDKTAIHVLPSTSGAAGGYWDETRWLELAEYLSQQS